MITGYKPKSVITNASWSMVLNVWQTCVSFFYTPFLIQHIGSDMYGLFVLLMSLAGLLGIMDLGLGEATLRFVSYYSGREDIEGINRVLRVTLTIYIGIAAVVWTAMYFASPWIAPLLAIPAQDYPLGTSLLRLTAISFGFVLVGRAVGTIPKALQRYDIGTKVLIGESLFQVTGSVILILMGLGIYGLVLWSVATSLIMLPVYLAIAKRLIPGLKIRPSFSTKGFREVFGYSIFALFSQIMGVVWSQADRILLGTLVSSSSVAFLTVPQNLAFRVSQAVNSAGGVLFPKFSASTDLRATERLFFDATLLLLCTTLVVFVPITVLMPDFLRLWISPEFSAKSAWVGQVIACSCMVRGAFVPYDSLFKGFGKPQYLSVLSVCVGLTSLGANAVLIPIYGLSGAGYCYVLTPIWGFTAILFAWRRLLRVASLRPLLRTLVVPICMGTLSLVLCCWIRSGQSSIGWLGLLSNGIAFLIITACLVLGGQHILGGGTRPRILILLSRTLRNSRLNRREEQCPKQKGDLILG